jgi:hypothetical protein
MTETTKARADAGRRSELNAAEARVVAARRKLSEAQRELSVAVNGFEKLRRADPVR